MAADPLHNAVSLLMLLGLDEARAVMGGLTATEAEQVRQVVAGMNAQHELVRSEGEFGEEDVTATRQLAGGASRYVQDLLEQAFGRRWGVESPDSHLAGLRASVAAWQGAPTEPALERLRRADLASVVPIVLAEPPQAGAVMLAALGPDFAARVLQMVPPRQRNDLIRRLALLGTASEAALQDLDAGLHEALNTREARKSAVQGGPGFAAALAERMQPRRDKGPGAQP
ncbi:MAG: flagellar motor switch protein FliG [Pseudomonadota bacterium]|jgi:flagellar motor switch protein FliG